MHLKQSLCSTTAHAAIGRRDITPASRLRALTCCASVLWADSTRRSSTHVMLLSDPPLPIAQLSKYSRYDDRDPHVCDYACAVVCLV